LFVALWRVLSRLLLCAGIAAAGLWASIEFTTAPQAETVTAAPTSLAASEAPVWSVDFDGDGFFDVANPTLGEIRGHDAYGSGKFGARRDGGKRKHEGADFVAAPGSVVFSPLGGVVTDIGYAYQGKEKLRFIAIKDAARQLTTRVFYVDPTVAVGDAVQAGDSIGLAESLAVRYPVGTTNHVHVELHDAAGGGLDPALYLPLGAAPAMAPPVPATAPGTLIAAR
jgi:murein DD-endopeptidase MepM/ murein hydrolase activator NlpD